MTSQTHIFKGSYVTSPTEIRGGDVTIIYSEGYFSMKKGILKSEICFLIHYIFQKIKKNLRFFTVFLGDQEGAYMF